MARKELLGIAVFLGLTLALSSLSFAAEKLKFGDAVKVSPTGRIPYLVALEKGFWKENGLEIDWVSFGSGTAAMQAVAARGIEMGWSTGPTIVPAASAGVPVIIVSDLLPVNDFSVWVSTKSRFRDPKDLRGIKIGVGGRGSVEYMHGRIVAKALGQEKEIKFLFTGGILESLAAMKAGVVDGVVLTPRQMWDMKLKGEVLELAPVTPYLPKVWLEHVIFAHKDFVKSNPDTIRKAVRAMLQGTNFVRDNQAWSMEKLKKEYNYSPETAKKVYEEGLLYSRDGKIKLEAVENLRNILIEFGIVPREKAVPAKDLVAWEFAS